jgi:ketosteroid isomerase-like protein
MRTTAVEVVDRFVGAWLRGDLEEVLACLTDDVVYTTSGRGGVATTLRGRDVVAVAFAEQVAEGDPDLVLAPVAGLGDRAIGEWSYPPAADGSVYRGIDVYTLRDGRIAAKDVFSKVA